MVHNLPLYSLERVATAMVRFCESKARDGYMAAVGRNALYGFLRFEVANR